MVLKIPGMLIFWGHPSTQYLQAVQGMVGRLSRMSTTFCTVARSDSFRGWKFSMKEVLSFICSSLDIPDSTVIRPSREAAYRRAQEATDISGSAALKTSCT